MKQLKQRKMLAVLVAIMMVFTIMPLGVFAETIDAANDSGKQVEKAVENVVEETAGQAKGEDFADMPANWSTAALKKAAANGLLKGYEEEGQLLIKGDAPIKRAEMAAVVNRAFGAEKKASLSGVADVDPAAWYADDIARAIKMGTFARDGKMRPEDGITRQEAFTVLARAFQITSGGTGALNSFADKDEVAAWAKNSLAAMAEAGYVKGSEGRINPKAPISRAEFAVVMDNLVKEYIVNPGEAAGLPAAGNVLVRAADAILKNVVIDGDLIIADGAGEGNVTLDGVKVRGRTLVRGGGQDSIIIKGSSDITQLILSKSDGKVRVVVEGDSKVEIIYIPDGSDDVIVEGKIGNIDLTGSGITVMAVDAAIGRADISGDNSTIIFGAGSRADAVTASGKAAGIQAEEGAVIDIITITGIEAQVTGKGQVQNVDVKKGGDNASINTPGTKINTEKGVEGTKGGKTSIPEESKAKNNETGTEAIIEGAVVEPVPGGGGGGGGGGSSSSVKVSAISVDQQDQTLTVGATLELSVTFDPTNSTNKNVTWASSDTDVATVDNEGTVTAVAEGTATITVTSDDGGFTDTVTITVAEPAPELSDLDIAGQGTTAAINYGDSEDVSVKVTNTGGTASFEVFIVFGPGHNAQTITTDVLAQGESQVVTFEGITAGLPASDPDWSVYVSISYDDGPELDSISGSITVEAEPADKQIESVETLADINVAYGTEVGEVGLPSTVEVTLDDETTQNLAVTWDDGTPAYDKDTAGEYVFAGTLTLPEGITNTGNLKASIKVIVAEAVVVDKNITSVAAIADINVANGTELSAAGLPTTVVVTLDDETTQNLAVTWDDGTPAYDKDTAGEYVFAGTLTLVDGIANAGDYKATVKVIVAAANVQVSSISVKGTGDATTITTDGGTLQMIAIVEPDNASNKAVTWSVDKPEVATIDSNGKLTARANGTVKVTAKAKDGSGKSGYVEITISNQTVTPPLSDAKAITSFKFESLTPAVTGVIDETAKTITLTVPYATNVTALEPTIIHTGDSISPADGSRDFANPVIYTVTAENGTTAKYTVTVNIAPAGSYTLTYIAGTGGTITGELSQTVTDGGNGTTVTAVPDEGYVFAQWSDGLLTAERTDTNVITSRTYTAIFAPDIIIEVGFESLTANGTSGETTTTVLYVKFDQEIPSLSPDNITLKGATLKLLTMSSTSNECSITIEDIKVKNGENVKVTINKAGYIFTPQYKEVAVYVQNVQAEINPASADFDKQSPENVETTINFGTATKIESIKKGDTALTKGTDYTVSGDTLTIKKEYLLTQPAGTTKLDIAFDQGNTRELSISIKNEGTYSIVVEEITGGFGGETAAAHKNNTVIEEAKEGDHITISIADLTGTYDAWKVKSAKFKDDNGVETNLNTANKRTHSFTMPASNVTVIIELEPEEDSKAPTISNSEITANRITDISLTLNWDKATDNLTPDGYLKYYVYQSELNDIGTVTDAVNNGTLLNSDGSYSLKNLSVKDLDPDKTYYFNVVVADYAGNKTAYTMKEVKTLKAVTDLDLTSKVTRPVKYETINKVFASGDQYSSTNAINWWKIEGDTKEQVYGKFEPDTVYLADVTLQAEQGYSLNDSTVFTYPGATDVSFEVNNNDPSRGDLTITFPATEAVTKYSLTLEGDNITSEPSESQIDENTEVTVTVNPDEGEQVVSFIVNDVDKTESLVNNQYTFTITGNTIIKVTYGNEYALISSGDNVVEFKVNDASVTTAKKGDTVTMLVTPAEGEELIGATLTGIDKEDVDEIEVGKKYTFTMPDKDVDAKITAGVPNKNIIYNAGIIGAGEIPLINGNLKDSQDKEIDSLTWSYFTNTLTLNGFEGNYLGRANQNPTDFDLELKGTNKITNDIHVNPGLKFQGQISIKGNGTLKITNSFDSNSEAVRGISFQNLQSIIKLKDSATVDISLKAKGSKGVAISNVMPFIGNEAAAYKGTAVWSAGDGESSDKPIEITYHVSKDTQLKGDNIRAGNNPIEELRSDGFSGTTLDPEDEIIFTGGTATVYAKYFDKYYKIIIIKDTPISDFACTTFTDTTASFNWTAATDAASVKIQQSLKMEDSWTDAIIEGGTLDTTSTSATVTGLEASTEYKFRLVVEGGDKHGDSNIVEVTTAVETQDQANVNAEAEKYESTATIDKEVEAGEDVTDTVIKLVNEAAADENIALSYSVTPGNYLEVDNDKIRLKAQKITEGDATEKVTITFTKNGKTATKEVTVTIKSSNKKMIKIGGIEYDLNGDALPDGLSWDEGTKTLAMNGYAGGAIYTNFEAGYELKKLEINGENTITINDETSTRPVFGFGTKTQLSITGNGTLTIEVTSTSSNDTVGIYSGSYYNEAANQNLGGHSGSTVNINENVTINISVESQKGKSYAMEARILNLMGGTLNIASKSAGSFAKGIDVVNFKHESGLVTTKDEGIVAEGNSYNPEFSRETPYVTSNKAIKITGLTWDSTNDATAANKAVEYTIYLKPDTAELKVSDFAVTLGKLEVYGSEGFNGSPMSENTNIEFDNNEATVYVKAEYKENIRYFKINLIKETVEP